MPPCERSRVVVAIEAETSVARELRPRAWAVVVASALVWVAIGVGSGCGAAPAPCATTGVCGSDAVCVAGACRSPKVLLAEASTRKVVFRPSGLALVSSRGPEPWDRADVPFGSVAAGRVALLLRFAVSLRESSRVASAMLVLDPMPGAAPPDAPVQIEVARIGAPWDPAAASWARLPVLSPPESRALASSWGGRRLLVDVTPQVKRWLEHRGDDHGLALLAAPCDTRGASYSLGVAGGRGPLLEVYLR
jgi:hypothetical protein